MNVLILGSGGREHALAWKISQSPLLDELYIAPGNGGTGELGNNTGLDILNFDRVARFCLEKGVGMVVVGPEAPLVAGIADYFASKKELQHIVLVGPSGRGAMLEGSKQFANEFMGRHDIPTARFFTVTGNNKSEGKAFLEKLDPPYVLKADGLAAGKGVLILDTLEEAEKELSTMLEGRFGEAGKTVVIEEFLPGIELSVFAFTDGESALLFPEAKDYKRIGEGDTGPNTGGMGAVSPVPFADVSFMEKVESRIVAPTIRGLQEEGIDYRGFLYFGLMNVAGDPFVIEYNVRLGDPEAEVVLPRIRTDLLEIFNAMPGKQLKDMSLDVDPQAVCTVVMASGGYPGSYAKGKVIRNLEHIGESIVFHAGTAATDEGVVTSGGRVLVVSSFGRDMDEALEKCYRSTGAIDFEDKYFRRDIGFDLKSRS